MVLGFGLLVLTIRMYVLLSTVGWYLVLIANRL